MSKLEKGQNVTKTAEETAVELYGEISMDSELIGKFITQQVAVAMSKKTKQYGKKIKKLEKGGRDRVSGESSSKNGTGGGGRASKKNKTSPTQTTTKSRSPHKSASLLSQGQKSILRRPFRGRSQKAGDTNSGTPGNGKNKKVARFKNASTSTLQTSKTDGAKLRVRSNKR